MADNQEYTDDQGNYYIKNESGRIIPLVAMVDNLVPVAISAADISTPGSDAQSAIQQVSALIQPNYRTPALRRFWTKLATVATSPVDIVTIGDSITEGNAVTNRNDSFTGVLRDQLRVAFQPAGVTGAEGYLPETIVTSTPTDPFAFTGSPVQSVSAGLGLKTAVFTATGTMTATVTCSSFDLLYRKFSTAGHFTVKIDAGSAVDVNAFNASTLGSVPWNSGALTPGEHTIVIAWVSGIVHIEGMMIYNGDETKGIRAWNGGHSGYRVQHFTGTEVANGVSWLSAITLIQPALVVMLWGTNDYRLATTIVDFKTELATLVALVRAACTVPPSIVLAMSNERHDSFTNPVAIAPYSSYLQAMREFALSDGNIALFDNNEIIGPGADGNGLVNADRIHLQPAGHRVTGLALARFVSP